MKSERIQKALQLIQYIFAFNSGFKHYKTLAVAVAVITLLAITARLLLDAQYIDPIKEELAKFDLPEEQAKKARETRNTLQEANEEIESHWQEYKFYLSESSHILNFEFFFSNLNQFELELKNLESEYDKPINISNVIFKVLKYNTNVEGFYINYIKFLNKLNSANFYPTTIKISRQKEGHVQIENIFTFIEHHDP